MKRPRHDCTTRRIFGHGRTGLEVMATAGQRARTEPPLSSTPLPIIPRLIRALERRAGR